jgi:hypothetical protein
MRFPVLAALAAVLLVALGVPGGATAQQSADELLNAPSANWNVYGPGQTHKGRRDKAVQGGGAMRVTVAKLPANAWDAGASSPISGAIRKGQPLILAFWARLESGGVDGKTEIAAAIQRSTSPYDPIVSGRVTLTSEWKLVHIEGKAPADYPAGAANIALSLGTAAHVIDLGPVYVMAPK